MYSKESFINKEIKIEFENNLREFQFNYDTKNTFRKFVFVRMGPASLLGALSLIEHNVDDNKITICDFRDNPFEQNNTILSIRDFNMFPLPIKLINEIKNVFTISSYNYLFIKIINLQIILYTYLKENTKVTFLKIHKIDNDVFNNDITEYIIDGTDTVNR